MDNATMHHTREVKELFTDRIDQRFLPAYSCALNPIERFWNVVKGEWRQQLLKRNDGFNEDETETELIRIIENHKH
jgi:transposase